MLYSEKEEKLNLSISEFKRRIDSCAVQYAQTSDSDFAVKSNLVNEICKYVLMCADYFHYIDKKKEIVASNLTILEFEDVYAETLIKCINTYDLSKSNGKSFFNMFSETLKFRIIDEGRRKVYRVKDNDGDDYLNIPKQISIDAMVFEDENEDGYSVIPDKKADFCDEVSNKEIVEKIVTELLMYIVELYDNLSNKANGDTRLTYFKIFYTRNVIYSIRKEQSESSSILKSFFNHEKEIIESLESPLIDFTYIRPARTIYNLYFEQLKSYKDIQNIGERSKTNKELDVPFKNTVVLAYLATQYKKQVSPASVSKMEKKFNDVISDVYVKIGRKL